MLSYSLLEIVVYSNLIMHTVKWLHATIPNKMPHNSGSVPIWELVSQIKAAYITIKPGRLLITAVYGTKDTDANISYFRSILQNSS